jgi:hypothetical protein
MGETRVSVMRRYISLDRLLGSVNRRSYLSGLGVVALSGCLGTGPGSIRMGSNDPLHLEIKSVDTQRVSLRVNDLGEEHPAGDHEVVDLEELDEMYHDPIREAAETRGLYGVEDPSEGLTEAFGDTEILRMDGTYYWVGVGDSTGVEVAFDAELADDRASDGDLGVLALSLENRGERTVEVGSGAPAPFGVLSVHQKGEPDDESHLLWTDAYEESDHVQTTGRSVTTVQDIGKITEVDPGARVEREYEIGPAGFTDGQYELADSVTVDDRENGGSLAYTVRIRVE